MEEPLKDENSVVPPVLATTEQKTPKEEKRPPRRRSSIGTKIINSFLAAGTEEIMSPIDPKVPVRPRRSVQMRILPAPVLAVTQRKRPIRYSFDIGERVAVKSCLKPSKGPILVRKGPGAPPRKSFTQQAALKVINKYRKSMGEVKTPSIKRTAKLKFHKICSIRVITPRPQYNPDKLDMPHSDDENGAQSNPNRERLSTVELILTPTSQSQLEAMQDKEVVQFNAEMVFGDGDLFPKASSSGEDVTETAIEHIPPARTSSEETEPKKVETKKKLRRKSLILGSASPLKSPAKVEKPRFHEETDQQVENKPEPTRNTRRSVRLKADIIEAPAESNKKLQERSEKNQKKRDHVPEEVTIEPQPKRSRRKSGYTKKEEDDVVTGVISQKKTDEKKSTIHNYFAPMCTKNVEKTAEKSPEEVRKEKKTRRSSAYFGTAKTAKESSIAPTKESDIVVISESKAMLPSTSTEKISEPEVKNNDTIIATNSSSSTSTMNDSIGLEVTKSQKTGKLAMIFSRSPAQPAKKVFDITNNEASTSSSSPAPSTPKFFSLFSQPPKTKVDTVPQPQITLSDSPIVSKRSPKKSGGVKRKEHWGDSHPETYQFINKMPSYPSIFEKITNSADEILFKSRPFDENILNFDDVDSLLREFDSEDPNLLLMKNSDHVPIEKLAVPNKCCPTTVFPTEMKMLVEGAEDEETIRDWLKRWKRRVRKERERELAKEKQTKNGGSKKGRKRKDEDEKDEDYELDGADDDLENPLVLIGPTGVGKTALIRALAKQENMRIISMGPETDRTGSEIKKKLYEAMRSHRVDQQPTHRFSTFFKTISQSTFTPKDQPSTSSKEYIQSLIVFEHVDVFFDTLDRHGISGLLEVVNDAAVPVVFTCQNDWPRSCGQLELQRRYLEIRLGRNDIKVQKYVQQIVYSCRNVFIDDSTIAQLSESVNHDLQALLRQAHLYSLAPTKPFPLTSREFVSNGFDRDWEKPRGTSTKTYERIEELMDQYSDVLPDGIVNTSHPRIDRVWDADCRALASKQSKFSEGVQKAYDALNGRYSRRSLIQDVLPLLVPIDRVERQKRAKHRRYLHRFKHHSEIPIDGDSLISVVRGWSINDV